MASPATPPALIPVSTLSKGVSGMKSYGPVILATAGIITVIVSLSMQMFSINHGTSGQLTIDSAKNANLWVLITGVLLLVVGWILYIFLGNLQPHTKYLAMYMLAFSSFFMSNLAMMFSTIQVNITNS
jgi:hypothetical protein